MRTRRLLVAAMALMLAVTGTGLRPTVARAADACDPGQAGVIYGTDGDDVLRGTSGPDVICGLNGNDILSGYEGNDRLYGGNGDDVLIGGDGNDTLDSGNGVDTVMGGAGDDTVPPSNGIDTISGNAGNDVLDGGNGDDDVSGGPGNDTLIGQNGDDFLDGGPATDNLSGGAGVDTCLHGETLSGCETSDAAFGADTDHDGLVDGMEPRFGGNANNLDTDGDGLRDGFEAGQGGPWHQAGDADSDDDGSNDATEDLDEDGLTALQEQSAGTDPLIPDTDGDGVDDGAEVAGGTNPLAADSDDDGLDDGVEPRLGTNPLDPDTDDDGILDGDEQYTTAASGVGGVSVQLTGLGDLASHVSILSLASEPAFTGALGQAGPAYDISLPPAAAAGLSQARITIPFVPPGSGSEADLRIFTLHPTGIWVPAALDANQGVDESANTVSATVSHFSIFAVFNIANWQTEWSAVNQACVAGPGGGGGEQTFIDIVFVLDSSGSMSSNDPSGLRRTPAKSFVDVLLPEDRAGVVDFDSFAIIRSQLTSNFAAVKAAIDLVNSSGGTNIGAGVNAGLNVLDAGGVDPDRGRVMILLTDGFGSYNPALTTRAAAGNVVIFTIGLGSSVDDALLTSIAEGTGGEYHAVADADDLPEVFREIEGEVDDDRDTDGDGLTDCEESRGMPDWGGIEFFSNPAVADTDGDELIDGVEVEKLDHTTIDIFGTPLSEILGTDYSYLVYSDPMLENTDGDPGTHLPALDIDEFTAGSNSRRIDSDFDTFDDSTEILQGLDPMSTDTDGDSLSDWKEVNELAEPDGDFDPRIFDEVTSPEEWVRLFGLGAACGDATDWCPGIRHDPPDWQTIPYLVGSVASGFAGPLFDARDLLGNIVHLDVIGAGLSLVGFIPFAGDIGKALGKVARIADLIPANKLPLFVRALSKLPGPPAFRNGMIDLVIGDGVRLLRGAGMTDAGLDGLIKGATDIKALARAASFAKATPSGIFRATWKDSETFLRGPGFLGKGKGFANPAVGGRAGWRIVDAWNPATRTALEAKTGASWDVTALLAQAAKDFALKTANPPAPAAFANVEWHFFASAASNRIMTDPAIFDRLQQLGIPFTIHLP